jgi:hypothetical protein
MHSAKECWMEGFHKAGQSTKPMASLVMLVSMGDMEGEECPVFFQNQSTIVTMLLPKSKRRRMWCLAGAKALSCNAARIGFWCI